MNMWEEKKALVGKMKLELTTTKQECENKLALTARRLEDVDGRLAAVQEGINIFITERQLQQPLPSASEAAARGSSG